MINHKYLEYTINVISIIKGQAFKAKEAKSIDEASRDYYSGLVMGYYTILTMLKNQAFAFCIDQQILRLSEINPEEDVLCLSQNPCSSEEDNWKIDTPDEEKVKGYLYDTLKLLKQEESSVIMETEIDNGSTEYSKGEIDAYKNTISTFFTQTNAFDIKPFEIGSKG